MQTLENFKETHSIKTLNFFKGEKNREFATVYSPIAKSNVTIIISEKYTDEKQAFVVPTANKDTGEVYLNTYTICNAAVTATRTM